MMIQFIRYATALVLLLSIVQTSWAQQWREIQKFSANDLPSVPGSFRFGESIDLDGNFAVVGATGYYTNPRQEGAAYVFELVNDQWVQRAKLTASDASDQGEFGFDVAIEGNIIVVGAPQQAAGKVYIFEKPTSGWVNATETTALTQPGASFFGHGVGLKGNTIAVAAPLADGHTTNSGKIFLYTKGAAASWTTATLEADLIHPTVSNDRLGNSLVLTDDYLVAGAATGAGDAGTAHLFEKGSGWVSKNTAELTIKHSNRGSNQDFGGKIAAEGDFIAVSSRIGNAGALVFVKPTSGWASASLQDQNYLISVNLPGITEPDFFGQSIYTGMDIDDSRLFYGLARSSTINVNLRPGVVVAYDLTASGATLTQTITPSDTINEAQFGASVRANDDHLLVAAPGLDSGVVYYFKKQYFSSSTAHLCFGETVDFNGQTISSAGTYTASFTAQDGLDSLIELTVTKNPPLSFAITRQEIACPGGTGSLTIDSHSGGNGGPYQYAIDGGNFQSSPVFDSLVAGSYQLTIADGQCERTFPTALNDPTALIVTSLGEDSPTSCANTADGSAEVTLEGGSGGYYYSRDGVTFDYAGVVSSSGLTFMVDSLPIGTQTIYFRDSNDCQITDSVTISGPDALTLSGITTDNSCDGKSAGSITLTAGGGTSPHSFSLDRQNFQSSTLFEQLPAGEYTATVKDANGCTTRQSFTIENSINITATASAQNVSCPASSDGKITISQITGGAAPYEYSLDNATFQSDSTFMGLAAGDYSVTVKDANGCTAELAVTIGQPDALSLSTTGNDETCERGFILVAAQGGVGAYEYSLDGENYQESNQLDGVTAGEYTVYVRDANGCVATENQIVGKVAELTVSAQVTESTEYPENGSIALIVTGGADPYIYVWSTGDSTATISDLVPNDYSVTVTDRNGCSVDTAFTVGGVTSLADLQRQGISIYPNPVIDQWQVRLPANTAIRSASLFSPQGELIQRFSLRGGINQLKSEAVKPGIYLLQLDNGVSTRLVIKK
ncbi:MAG: T9SS type A sorting domain-containing protein [Bacteroidota bacterium]